MILPKNRISQLIEEINEVKFEIYLKNISKRLKETTSLKDSLKKIKELENAIVEFFEVFIAYYMKKYNINQNNIDDVVLNLGVVITLFPNYEDPLIFYVTLSNKKEILVRYKGYILGKKVNEKKNILPIHILDNLTLLDILRISKEITGEEEDTIINDWLLTLSYRFDNISEQHQNIFGI